VRPKYRYLCGGAAVGADRHVVPAGNDTFLAQTLRPTTAHFSSLSVERASFILSLFGQTDAAATVMENSSVVA
jgi:hypothetical protein